ncbi:hypothetical protein ACFQ3S_10380 [Mucilaginibacter terrae]|uniref:hypothetical protein n=1 Tax=Mucilaginibacter terrae TaxID=1955052 RepID=UPI00363E63D6
MNYNDTQPCNVALLVHTCDRYRFLYEGFSYFFHQYWDFNTRCNYYFATEELTVDIPQFKNIKSGKGEWADRLRYLLEHIITEKYVVYFQEDMWLNKPVSSTFFNQLFNVIEQNKYNQVKLDSADIYNTQPTPLYIEGFNVALLNNQASGYLMSHQVTVWNKAFLIQQLYKGEHPWRNERRGTQRLKKLNPEIYHIDYFAQNGQAAINKNEPQSMRSEYHTISGNSMLQNNILPYIALLQQAGPKEQAFSTELLNHYQNQLTHDGKAKPRKEDIFKKMKKWISSLIRRVS